MPVNSEFYMKMFWIVLVEGLHALGPLCAKTVSFFLLHDNIPESSDCLLIFDQKTSYGTCPSLEFIRFESSRLFPVFRI